MIPQIGYIYTYEGTCCITLAMDDVNEQDLEECSVRKCYIRMIIEIKIGELILGFISE